MRQVYIELISELVMLDLTSRTQRLVNYKHTTGEASKVTIMSAELVARSVRVANLLPALPNDDILTALKRYGAPRGIKDDAWTQLYWYRVGKE